MASSGSVDFSVTRDDLITGAMRAARIIGQDQTPTNGEITTGAQALNMLVKQWQGKADFAPGLKVWSRKRSTLFLALATHSYALGPSGVHWTSSFVRTTLTAGKNASATSISVASTSGMTIGDNIGIVLTDGSIGWTTISAIPGAITLPANSLGAAASGAYVYAYTTKARRPLYLLTAVLRDANNSDQPLSFFKTVEEYESLTEKGAEGDPTQVFYEPQLVNGVLYTNSDPLDLTKQVYCTYLSPIEDFDSATDTPDYPQEWFRALKYQLAIDLWPEFKGGEIPASLKMARDESLMMAQGVNAEESDVFYEPGRD